MNSVILATWRHPRVMAMYGVIRSTHPCSVNSEIYYSFWNIYKCDDHSIYIGCFNKESRKELYIPDSLSRYFNRHYKIVYVGETEKYRQETAEYVWLLGIKQIRDGKPNN